MRLASIASGSGGNCIYAASDRFHILIDAGIPLKRIEAGLSGLGLTAADIDAVLITHEHSDHIGGLGPLVRKYNIPVFATPGTIGELTEMKALSGIDESLFNYIIPDTEFLIGDLKLLPIAVSHDAAEPVMYRIECNNAFAGVLTDTGVATGLSDAFKDVDVLFLEANHDERMLLAGPYPYFLKQRILSDKGHLSNESAGKLIASICGERLKTVVLSHLSKTNNYTELALESVKMELALAGVAEAPELIVAPEKELSRIVTI